MPIARAIAAKSGFLRSTPVSMKPDHEKRLLGVLLKRHVAAGHRVEPDGRAFVQKVEQHLFVIAAQTDGVAVILAEFQHVSDDAGRVRPPVY